jgi:hypothetical protein
MRLRFPALLAPICLLCACASDGPAPMEADLAPAPGIVALENAEQLLLEGNAEDAMLELDDALEVLDRKSEVQFMRGAAALRMGASAGNAFFFEDARRSFLDAKEVHPAAWIGAARSTWMQFYEASDPAKLDEALGYARTSLKVRGEDRAFEEYFEHSAERNLGEIAFTAYTAAKSGTLPESRAPELFTEALDAFESELGRDPTSSWAWEQIANLYLWEDRREDARTTITSGLALNPEDPTLHATQVRLAEEDGTWSEVIRIYESFVAEHDGSALGHWYLGRAYYDDALATLVADSTDQSAGFLAAESHLQRARKIEPSYTESCMGYEVISRNGLGWSHYHGGRLKEAAAAWWSMEELFEGGLRWEVQGKLFSGLDSLAFALGAQNTEWEKSFRPDPELTHAEAFPHLVEAASIASKTFEYDSEDWNRANNSGYFNRDLGVQYERLAVASMEENPELAQEYFSKTLECMELSYAAYTVASRLAPSDSRTVNDTGLILAYYLQRDVETAIKYFKDSIDVGLLSLKELGVDAEEAHATRVAVGDAYQNLGVLELTLRGNTSSARPYFDQCMSYEESDGGTRDVVTSYYLPLCDKIDSGDATPELVIQAYRWGQLELDEVRAREAAMDKVRALMASN